MVKSNSIECYHSDLKLVNMKLNNFIKNLLKIKRKNK